MSQAIEKERKTCEGETASAWKRRACNDIDHHQTPNNDKLRPAAFCAVCWAFGCSTKYLVEVVDKLIKVDLQ